MTDPTRTSPKAAPTRRQRSLTGVLLGLAGHAVAVAAGVVMARFPHWAEMEGMGAGAGLFVVIEAVVLINGVIAVRKPRTRDLGVGFFYGWLGTWLLLCVGITANDLRYR